MAGVWTKNFQSFKNSWLCGAAIEGLSELKDSTGTLRWTVSDDDNYFGNSLPITSPMAFLYVTNPPGGTSYACGVVRVGSSATAPAATDYNLNGSIAGISYLSVVNEKPTWDEVTGAVSNTIKLTLQNTGDEPVMIQEWGLFLRLSRYRTNAYPSELYLVYHATLDTPVTLAASQSATLTLTRSVTLTDPVVWPE